MSRLIVESCSVPVEDTLTVLSDIEDSFRCQLIPHQPVPGCSAYLEQQAPCSICPHRGKCQKSPAGTKKAEEVREFSLTEDAVIRYRTVNGEIQTGPRPYAEIRISTSQPGLVPGLVFTHPNHPGLIYRTY